MIEQALIPLFDRQVLADAREIEYRDGCPRVAEARGGADHERGLAHLAGGQDVAELAPREAFVKLLIRLALDIGGRIRAQGAAGDIERSFRVDHGLRAPRIN